MPREEERNGPRKKNTVATVTDAAALRLINFSILRPQQVDLQITVYYILRLGPAYFDDFYEAQSRVRLATVPVRNM